MESEPAKQPLQTHQNHAKAENNDPSEASSSSYEPSSLEKLQLGDEEGSDTPSNGLSKNESQANVLASDLASSVRVALDEKDLPGGYRRDLGSLAVQGPNSKDELASAAPQPAAGSKLNALDETSTLSEDVAREKFSASNMQRRQRLRSGGRRGLLCLDCGKRVNHKTGKCDHCEAELAFEQSKVVNDQQAVPSGGQLVKNKVSSAEPNGVPFQLHELSKLVALAAAFATSGVFFSKGMVSAILWRSMHGGSQQAMGWVAFAVSVILGGAALFTIQKEFSDAQHDKLKKLGGVSLLIASFISYYIFSGRLRTIDAEIDNQMVMWTEMMENGGYEREMMDEDEERTSVLDFDSKYESDSHSASESGLKLEQNQ